MINEILTVSDEESIDMLKRLARNHALLVGPSSGAVAAGVQKYAAKLTKNDLVVMIFGDSGRAYLTKNFYAQDETTPHMQISHKETHLLTM